MRLMRATEARITSSGQFSLPAALRTRWQVETVLVIDRGDYAIVRPIPHDMLSALKGSLAGPGPSSEQAREAERRAEGSGRTHT